MLLNAIDYVSLVPSTKQDYCTYRRWFWGWCYSYDT